MRAAIGQANTPSFTARLWISVRVLEVIGRPLAYGNDRSGHKSGSDCARPRSFKIVLYDLLDRKGATLLYQPKRVQEQVAARQPRQQWVNWIGLAVLVGVAYFLAARLSLLLLTKPDGVAVFWPASGVAAGAMIALGSRARLPVAVGAAVATIVANLMGDRTLLSAVVFALCNAGEALLTGWLIQRYFGANFGLDRLSHVLGLVTAAVVATAVSGIGGTAGFPVLPQFHRTNSGDMATLVCLRCTRNSYDRAADHRTRIGYPRAAAAHRACRRDSRD